MTPTSVVTKAAADRDALTMAKSEYTGLGASTASVACRAVIEGLVGKKHFDFLHFQMHTITRMNG